jgi:(S)-2-hydroxyglutarate dehydrogenase
VSTDTTCDVIIIGGGIVGLSTAYQLAQRWPKLSVALIEKEPRVGQHQSTHNSGVLHSGIYYKPGSLKARNCVQGRAEMLDFCKRENIGHDVCGKVIVAVEEDERPSLDRIHARGRENGVRCEKIGREELARREPAARGIEAIWVPEAGIVDFAAVCNKLAQRITEHGHRLILGQRVTRIEEDKDALVVHTTGETLSCRRIVACAGLHSDRVERMVGAVPRGQMIPFRADYYRLVPERRSLCRNLIYPVPDLRFPFLGVHLTRMTDGTVECGPNAVLAFAREGYHRTDVNWRELGGFVNYVGLRRFLRRHWPHATREMVRSWSKRAFAKALQHLVPELTVDDLEPGPTGVRAHVVLPDGALVEDFELRGNERVLHVVNAPSPAATSALSLGGHIVETMDALSSGSAP